MATMQKERLRPLTMAEQRELKADREGEQRAGGSGAASDGAAGGGRRGRRSRRRPARRGLSESGAVTYLVRRFNRVGLGALGIAAGRGRRPTYDAAARARIVATAQRSPDRKVDGTATWSLLDAGADGASGGAPARGRDDDPAGAARRGQLVPADADVVPDRDGAAQAQGRGGAGGRSADGRKRGPSTRRTG